MLYLMNAGNKNIMYIIEVWLLYSSYTCRLQINHLLATQQSCLHAESLG